MFVDIVDNFKNLCLRKIMNKFDGFDVNEGFF